VLATDSPRTPAAAADALQAQLQRPHFCYRWGGAGNNPYRGLLALADAFVVTGESMSMLAEALDTGKPLFIFDVGDGATPWWRLPHSFRYKPLSHRFAMRFGPRRMRRDIGKIQQRLVDSGRARWLALDGLDAAAAVLRDGSAGQAATSLPAGTLATVELERAAQAVRQLVIPR
jgi:hypothetical protein